MAVAPLTDRESGSRRGCQWRLGEPFILTIDSDDGFCYGCLYWKRGRGGVTGSSLITIFICMILTLCSCLHFGQKSGKFNRTESS